MRCGKYSVVSAQLKLIILFRPIITRARASEGESGDSPGLGGLDALQSHQLEGAREGPVLAPQDLLNPNMRKLSRCFEAQNATNRDTFHQLEAE